MSNEPNETVDVEPTPEAVEEEAPQRPSLIKQIVPWVITAGIFYWIFRQVDFNEVWRQMKMADLWVLIPAMIGLVAIQVGLEVWCFTKSYHWFADRRPSYWRVAVLRLSAFPTQAVFAPLAGFQLLAYAHKIYKMNWLRVLSADIFAIYPDQLFGFINIIIAVILAWATDAEPLHWAIYAVCAGSLIMWPKRAVFMPPSMRR